MLPSDIFFNSVGRLRSGWRLTIFTILFWIAINLLTGVIFTILSLAIARRAEELLITRWGFIAQGVLLFAAAMAVGYVCLKLLESLPLKALGWAFHQGWLRDLLLGSLIGAATLILAALLATVSGGFGFTFNGAGIFSAVGKTLVVSLLIFIPAAAAEEILFRGYPLQTMARAKLAWVGVVLTSLAFALAHQENPNLDAQGVLPGLAFANTMLAGAWLAFVYLRTRSMWLPLGVHWAWNWMMAAVLGLPVSGIKEITPDPLLRANDLGPAWLTGGAYGIEAGAACTVALMFSIIFIRRTKLLSATAEMQALTSHEIAQPTATMKPQQDYMNENNQPPVHESGLTADE